MKISVVTKSGLKFDFDDVMSMDVANFKGNEVAELSHGDFHVKLEEGEHAVAHRIRRHSLEMKKEVLRQYVLLTTFRVIFCNSDGTHCEEQDFVEGDAFRDRFNLAASETVFWILFPRKGFGLKNIPKPRLQNPDKVMEFFRNNPGWVEAFFVQVMMDQEILNADGSFDYREFVL